MISHQKQQIDFGEYKPILQSEDILKNAQVRQDLADQNLAAVKDAVDTYGRLRSYLINDNARNYFDQELKKLTGAIKENAGLDFSNKANLASVLNIGKTFENDKYIVNGLKWGKEKERRAKELQSMDEKFRNADNDLVFMNDIYEYEKEGGLDSKVNSGVTYSPYTDVSEEILKIEKEVEASVRAEVSKMGNGLLNVKQIEEKTAEEVRRRIQNLSPEHQQQVNIHAKAEMIRMGKENTYKVVKETQLAQLEQTEMLLVRSQQFLADYNSLSAADKKKYEADFIRANEIIKESTRTKKVLEDEIKLPADQYNPDYYLTIFRNRFIGQLAEKAAYTKTTQEVRDDKVFLKQMDYNLEMSKMREQASFDIASAQLKQLMEATEVTGNAAAWDFSAKSLENLAINSSGENLLEKPVIELDENNKPIYNNIGQLKVLIKERYNKTNNSKEQRYYGALWNKLNNLETQITNTSDSDIIDFGVERFAQAGQPISTFITNKAQLSRMTVGQLLDLRAYQIRRPKKGGSDPETAAMNKELANAMSLSESGMLDSTAWANNPGVKAYNQKYNTNLKQPAPEED
jgi:hypothetical protein